MNDDFLHLTLDLACPCTNLGNIRRSPFDSIEPEWIGPRSLLRCQVQWSDLVGLYVVLTKSVWAELGKVVSITAQRSGNSLHHAFAAKSQGIEVSWNEPFCASNGAQNTAVIMSIDCILGFPDTSKALFVSSV